MSVELIARAWSVAVPAKGARRSSYKASWTSIVSMLRGELRAVGASNVIVEFDLREGDIRNDGWMRSTARPNSPGVRLTFKSRYGELAYECGTWTSWEHNVYAVARTLRAQRMIQKDGAVKGDQVYRGFKALPNGGAVIGASEWANTEAARRYLATEAGLATSTDIDTLYRAASRKHHPDIGGSEAAMSKVNRAKAYIDEH